MTRYEIYIVHEGHITLSYIPPCTYIHTYLHKYTCLKFQLLKIFDTQIRFSVRLPPATGYPQFPGIRVVTRLCPNGYSSPSLSIYPPTVSSQ